MQNQIRVDGITYELNLSNKTASIISCNNFSSNIAIPDSIQVGPTPYDITRISEGAFRLLNRIKSIQFGPNSKLQIIEQEAFHGSTLESITLPRSLNDLRNGWCSYTSNLVNINIDPANPNFILYEDKYLLKKSTNQKENFDVLLFCSRNVQNAMIPDFIEIIGPNAFEETLQQVMISQESKLRKIDKSAFYFSKIESIDSPHHLTEILDHAFYCCYNLTQVGFPSDCELTEIGKEAFYKTKIERLSISPHLTKIFERAFFGCPKLREIKIPPKSNLTVIEKEAFQYTPIKYFMIPTHLTKISAKAFFDCQKLQKIKVAFDSELQVIENSAFENSSIEKFIFPSSLTFIGERAFYECRSLRKVEFPFDSKLQIIENSAFENSSIESFFIPSNLTSIGKRAFYDCQKLRKIDFWLDSAIQTIGDGAFYRSSITSFSFPPHLTNFGTNVFCRSQLKIVEIVENTEMTVLNTAIFYGCNDVMIMIPLSLSIRFNLQ